jgi:hypothetical protein
MIIQGVMARDLEQAPCERVIFARAAFFAIAAYRHWFGIGVRRALASSSPSKF